MHFVFLSDNMKFSGGRKLHFEYAAFLRSRGYLVDVLVQDEIGTLAGSIDVTVVPDFSPESIPKCDVIIATTPREVQLAFDSKCGDVVHFCQGFEITDLQQRVNGEVIPLRFQGSGLLCKIKLALKKRSWKKKIARIEKVYRLPTKLVTVSKHLKEELETLYKRDVNLCLNGIHKEYFYPKENFEWGEFSNKNPLKIINIGPIKVTFKGIKTTLKAIEVLKEEGYPVEFIRVAPVITTEERDSRLIDKCYENISPEKLGEVIRGAHLYISNSTEGEGFGLPALEAISSGLIAVLSSICSYQNFSKNNNFCYFVPEHDSDATVEAVKTILSSTNEQICELRKKSLSVADEFSFEKSCRKFEEIIKKPLSGFREMH
jgi:glycosyltransferase involved in cell wall biosynthesis